MVVRFPIISVHCSVSESVGSYLLVNDCCVPGSDRVSLTPWSEAVSLSLSPGVGILVAEATGQVHRLNQESLSQWTGRQACHSPFRPSPHPSQLGVTSECPHRRHT